MRKVRKRSCYKDIIKNKKSIFKVYYKTMRKTDETTKGN